MKIKNQGLMLNIALARKDICSKGFEQCLEGRWFKW